MKLLRGPKGINLILIALMLSSLISLHFGLLILSPGDLGNQPNIKIFSGEKLVPATWIKNYVIRYGVWDVRKENGNALVFMVVCSPENGTLIKDNEVSARVLAVRLTLEMAKVVQWITKQSENVEQLVDTIGNVIDKAVSIAESTEQWKVARELRNLKFLFSQKAEVVLTLANIVTSSKKPAETLIQERSDQATEHFLTSIASTGIAQSSRATLMVSFVVRALELLGISTAEWMNALYDKIIYGQMPLLEALAQTYGRYETNRMFLQLASRI